MEWQQIIGFTNLIKLGSFTRAARATFRTQSALSQQIKNLEAELDISLIERIGKRNFRLTSAGESFMQFSVDLLSRRDHLIERLNEIKGRQVGRLRLAVHRFFVFDKQVEIAVGLNLSPREGAENRGLNDTTVAQNRYDAFSQLFNIF